MNPFVDWRRLPSRCLHAALVSIAIATPATADPQLPDFVYQGRLEQSAAPANGLSDLTFALFDAPEGGNPVGATITESDFPVSDGLFSVSLSFPGAFTGTQLYLQVTVEGTPMLPRQAVATAPVAQFALSGAIGVAAGGDLVGSYPNPTLRDGTVISTKIATGAVGNSKLATDSVTASKIFAGAVIPRNWPTTRSRPTRSPTARSSRRRSPATASPAARSPAATARVRSRSISRPIPAATTTSASPARKSTTSCSSARNRPPRCRRTC